MAKYYKIATVQESGLDVRLHGCIGTINRMLDPPSGTFFPVIRSEVRRIGMCEVRGVPINESDTFTEVIL